MSVGGQPRKRSWIRSLCCTALVSLVAVTAVASSERFSAQDQDELNELREQSPEAYALFERAEQASAAQHYAEAEKLYARTLEQAPAFAVPARSLCMLLTAQGQRSRALEMCRLAVRNMGSARDLRALVGALVAGPDKLAPNDLAYASKLAKKAVDFNPSEPWGFAAECDIARAVGDEEGLARCTAQLEAVAPDSLETARARALLPWSLRVRPFLVPGLWAALALFVTASFVRRARKRGLAAVAALFVLVARLPSAAAEQPEQPAEAAAEAEEPASERIVIDPEDPEAALRALEGTNNAMRLGYVLMELSARADDTLQSGDFVHAEKYFNALAKVVPERSVAFMGLCRVYRGMNKRELALETCRAALGREGSTVNDYADFVNLLLDSPTPLSEAERTEAREVAQHVASDLPDSVVGYQLQCDLAVRLSDYKLLADCTEQLTELAPNDPRTASFQWASAMSRGDLGAARSAIEKARSSGLDEKALAKLEAETAKATHSAPIDPLVWVVLAGVGLALVIALFALKRLKRGPEPRTA